MGHGRPGSHAAPAARRTAWTVAGAVVCLAAVLGLVVIVVPTPARSGRGPASGARRVSAAGASSSTVAVPSSTSPAAKPVAASVPSPCVHNRKDQLVVVSLTAQRMWLCHRSVTTRAFPITSGRDGHGDATPTGSFHIQGRNKNSVLDPGNRGKGYEVKFWLPFDAPNYGFHDASWQHAGYGSSAFRAAHGSQGCVHMPLPAIRYFYRWVAMGTAVHIVRA